MARLISAATGNFTAAGTWKKAATVGFVDSEAATFDLSNVQQSSNTFTPANTDVIDAVVLKLSNIISATGTITVELYNNTTAGVAKTLTVNASDLPTNGWAVFKFGTTETPNGTDAYKIRAVRSVADGSSNRITFFASTASFADVSRLVRITTTAAPASGDDLFLCGEITGAGAATSFTVTMDSTATTSYGTSTVAPISICRYCTLTYGTSASTNYVLRFGGGPMIVFSSGTLNVGTSGTRMPSTSTAVLEFNSTTAGLIGRGGTINGYGATKASVNTLLTADATASGSPLTLTVGSTSGWAANDVIGIASTSKTASECETKTITSVTNGTQFVIPSLTNNHSGTSPTQAEVVNLTRNVKVRSVGGGDGFIFADIGTSLVFDYCELYNLGRSAAGVSGNSAVIINGTATLFTVTNCAIHDIANTSGIAQDGVNFYSNVNNVTFSNNSCYGWANPFEVAASIPVTYSVDSNYFVRNTSSTAWVYLRAPACGFTNNRIAGCAGPGLRFQNFGIDAVNTPGTFSGIAIHSNASYGLQFDNNCYSRQWMTLSNFVVYRNGSFGIWLAGAGYILDSFDLFGNDTANIALKGASDVWFKNLLSASDTTYSTAYGVYATFLDFNGFIFIDTADFSVNTGIRTTHSVDINTLSGYAKVVTNNCKTTAGSNSGGNAIGAFTSYGRYNQTAGDHRMYFNGSEQLASDNTIFHTAAPSLSVSAGSSKICDTSGMCKSYGMLFNMDNGVTRTVGVWVRKLAGYTGAQPRLVLKANAALGVANDTVLATMTAGTGTWEQLSGTTPSPSDDGAFEFVVEFDKDSINIDDWTG
jgi:hypothetical protein